MKIVSQTRNSQAAGLAAALLALTTFAPIASLTAADEVPVPEALRAIIGEAQAKGGARRLLERAKADTFKDIPYVENGHERQKLDLYVPASRSGPVPLVCFIHGGGWRNGQKSSSTALPLITQGYAIAGIGYRLSDAGQFPAQIHDCKAAIRWLRANAKKYNIDPDRIGVWGPSAGGHLSALLGTSGDVAELEGALGSHKNVSSRVQAVCDFYGPTDFLLSDVGGKSDSPEGPVALLLGGPAPKVKDIARQASPANWITKDDPPFLIFQGGRDRTVPPIQSQKFAELLKKAGLEATLIEFPEAEHGGPAFQTPETIARVVAFFDRHLKRK